MRTQQQTSPDLVFLASVKLKPRSPDDAAVFVFVVMMPNIPIFQLGYLIFVVRVVPERFFAIALMGAVVPILGYL
ncbi:hypothetical protein DL95DRAFT_395832, partial [Leptodontidium sp. 2 PMI_412]